MELKAFLKINTSLASRVNCFTLCNKEAPKTEGAKIFRMN